MVDTDLRPTGTEDKAVGRRRRGRREYLPYVLLLPAVLMELLIHIIPMLVGVVISFFKLTQFFLRDWQNAPFGGLSNYRFAVDVSQPAGMALLHSLWVTAAYTVVVLVVAWLIAMAAAILTQRPFRGRGLVRTLFLVPFALPVFASVITWNFMAQRDTGVINHVLVDQLHLLHSRPFWLIGPHSFWTIVVVSVWRTWPFAFLMLTAGLQSIPGELYEAATLDGAGILGQIRWVTMPLLAPINRVLVLVLFLWTFNDFTTPYMLFGQAPPHEADLMSIHIYDTSFGTWNFGVGSAMSVLLLLFLLIVTSIYLKIANRRSDYA